MADSYKLVYRASMEPRNFSKEPDISDAWLAEVERFEYDIEHFESAWCAELAEELDLFRVQALSDPNFDESYAEWDWFIIENEIWLPLEQSCHDGVLLPMDQRALRVTTCPLKLLKPLRRFFEVCPAHVKHHLALIYYLVVRMERAQRTGQGDWRPETAEPRSPFHDTVFFRPQRLVFRKYRG